MGNLSDDEYQLLRYSLVARKALMETTLGNPEAFTEGTVEEVLERAQANIRKGVEDQLKGEVEKREAAESEARNYRARHEERLTKLSSVASAIGRWCGYAMYLALTSIFVVGFYATLPSSFPQLVNEARYGAQILIVISAAVTVWSALEGGNIGFQLGGQETDFVLLAVNPKGVDSMLKSKVKLGADASAAIGPKGRDAEAATDLLLRAEILTYSRSRGLFAGVSLEGSTLREDGGANEKVYGKKVTARQIVRQHAVDDFNLAEGFARQQVRSEVVAEQRSSAKEEMTD